MVLAGPINLAAGRRDARCTGPIKGAYGGLWRAKPYANNGAEFASVAFHYDSNLSYV